MPSVVIPYTHVAAIRVACIDRQELVSVVSEKIKSYSQVSSPFIVFDLNGHAISLAYTNAQFMACLEQADLVHADGESVVKFSRWSEGLPVPERSATTDTITDIPEILPDTFRHYLLGGTEELAQQCASMLCERYPQFVVAGAHHGYFDKEKSALLIEEINATKPDILWVGLGKPIEQEWIIKNKEKLNVPVIISCGGCFNYVTGSYKRAPQWMQKAGIEWLHRMMSEPKKLFWRYLVTNPHAIYCAFKYRKVKHK